MIPTPEAQAVNVYQSSATQGQPASPAFVTATTRRWTTPAIHLASRIAHRDEVRLVLERLEPDHYSVFVVLDRDPEDLLDEIFEAEQDLHGRYRGIPFDVRVIRPAPDWSDADLRRDSVCIHDRALFHGKG